MELSGAAEAEGASALMVLPPYHMKTDAEGLIPTRVELRGGAGLELSVEYPPPAPQRFAFADRVLAVYEGTVRIGITLRVTGSAVRPAELIVTCQPCTDRACLEPVTLTLPVTIVGQETGGRVPT